LKYALWVDRITKKKSTRHNPFELVYGMEVTLPVNLKLLVYHLLENLKNDKEDMEERTHQLVHLDEERINDFDHLVENQERINKKIDKKARLRCFEPGDIVFRDDFKDGNLF
jgi:hypothetical protein